MEQEAQRRKWRDRQQRSRKNRADAEAEREFAELKRRDPIAARFQELWAEITAKPITKPGVPLPDPGPARLPTLAEWHKFLKSIAQTVAVQEEIARVEAAIASGMTEISHQVGSASE